MADEAGEKPTGTLTLTVELTCDEELREYAEYTFRDFLEAKAELWQASVDRLTISSDWRRS